MASKELIEKIKHIGIEEWRLAIEKIEKDLEVLDIIKRSIYNRETHKYVLNEKLKGQKFMNISLYISGDTDCNKIKEWLDE